MERPVLTLAPSDAGPGCVQNEPKPVTFHTNTIFHVAVLSGIASCPLRAGKTRRCPGRPRRVAAAAVLQKLMSSCELLVKVTQRFSITCHFRSNGFTRSFFSYLNICLFKAPAKSLSCLAWRRDEMDFSSVFHLDLMI